MRLVQFDASKMHLGARALRKRLHLRSWCHQIQNRIWSGKSTYLKFPTKSGPWKNPWTAVKKSWRATKNLRLMFIHFLKYVVVFSRVFHWNLWNHWSFQAVLALIDLKLVDEQLLLLRLWSVCGAWWVSPYICQHISQDGQDQHNHYINLYKYHGFSMVFDGLEVTAGC